MLVLRLIAESLFQRKYPFQERRKVLHAKIMSAIERCYPTRLTGRTEVHDYLRDYPSVVDLHAVTSLDVHQSVDPEVVVVEFEVDGVAVRTGRPYEMRYIADTSIGSTEYTQPIQLEDKASVLLTTEKPMELTIKNIRSQVALEEQRCNQEANPSGAFTAHFTNASKGKQSSSSKKERLAKSKAKGFCTHCEMYSHKIEDCRKLKPA